MNGTTSKSAVDELDYRMNDRIEVRRHPFASAGNDYDPRSPRPKDEEES